MEFSIKIGGLEKERSACVVAGVYTPRKLSPAASSIDQVSGGYLSTILRRGDMQGKRGSTLLLHNVPKISSERVLLVGLGREQEFNEQKFREAVRTAIKTLDEIGVPNAALGLTELPVKKRDLAWRVLQTVLVATDSNYRFDRLKSKHDEEKLSLAKVTLMVSGQSELKRGETALEQALAIAEGVNLTKDLGNLPPNICTPTYLAEQASQIAKKHHLKLEVLEKKDMERLGMGSLLSVARGSRQPPKLIILQYSGAAKKQKPIVLVGKGVTFDTGGISIKPAAEMDEMKFDMCGAASVLGAIKAAAQMHLPLNVVGIIPTTENMPGGNASRPGDVVTSMSGQSIEILNTDAEGRLILCDALTYAERFQPAQVIDIATLTGACVIALGHVASGLYSNDEMLARDLLQSGDYAQDRAWQMPLWEDYQEQLKSNFADMANIGGRPAGSITAACFLWRFAKKYTWAHLDIAGTAWKSGKEKGATGRPVPLLTQFLIRKAAKA
ncbi:MAG TPA: leucyl aminopeptidase [Burkholderiales bacterium]|nr:leucyl aminopeptidase [Burkholderiales bacterium]